MAVTVLALVGVLVIAAVLVTFSMSLFARDRGQRHPRSRR